MDKQFFLKQPRIEATAADVTVARDLADTLETHRATCVGMAANMIGERKRIIAVLDEASNVLVMLNPEIVSCEEPYNAMEGRLSLTFPPLGLSPWRSRGTNSWQAKRSRREPCDWLN